MGPCDCGEFPYGRKLNTDVQLYHARASFGKGPQSCMHGSLIMTFYYPIGNGTHTHTVTHRQGNIYTHEVKCKMVVLAAVGSCCPSMIWAKVIIIWWNVNGVDKIDVAECELRWGRKYLGIRIKSFVDTIGCIWIFKFKLVIAAISRVPI